MDDGRSEMPDTITFTNTTTYGRIVGQPSKDSIDQDAPDNVKYVKGYGVRFIQFIAIEC